MKELLIIIATTVVFVAASRSIAQPETDSYAELQAAAGAAKPVANALSKAINEQNHPKIKAGLKALIVQGEVELALAVLNDQQDETKQDAALAVSEVKTKRVAERLLATYASLDVFVYGGTEDELERMKTLATLEAAIEKVTGTQSSHKPTTTDDDKRLELKRLTDVVRAMPN